MTILVQHFLGGEKKLKKKGEAFGSSCCEQRERRTGEGEMERSPYLYPDFPPTRGKTKKKGNAWWGEKNKPAHLHASSQRKRKKAISRFLSTYNHKPREERQRRGGEKKTRKKKKIKRARSDSARSSLSARRMIGKREGGGRA